MRIVVFGATGYAGSHIVTEAVRRGHEVVAYSGRAGESSEVEGVEHRTGSLTDPATQVESVKDVDVIVVAAPPRGDVEGQVRPAIAALADEAEAAEVRLGVIGGAASLEVEPGGPRLLDTPGFPEAFKAEAVEMAGVLEDLRGRSGHLDWFYVSPAAGFHAGAPGEPTGRYRVGGDQLLTDESGESFISGADLALAIVDELEKATHSRQRFTVAY